MSKIIITIDGPSGSGKSSTAKEVAKKLSYRYINTGLMYRAVTLHMIQHNIDILDSKQIDLQLYNIDLDFKYDPKTGISNMYLNGKDVMEELYKIHVDSVVAQVSIYKNVRDKVTEIQKTFGDGKGIVIDGRDTAKVFPNAELKIFMTANIIERTKRRYQELIKNKCCNISLQELTSSMQQRDKIDKSREISPLEKAADAVEIDNSCCSFQDIVSKILKLAHNAIKKC